MRDPEYRHATKLTSEHERYEAFLQARRVIHNRITAKLERPLIDKAMDEIAVFVMDGVSLDTPTAEIVLVDFAIYFVRDNGKTMVERERDALPPEANADERALLDAMCRPVYGLVEVIGTRPGIGLDVVELRSGAEVFIHDTALSRSAAPEAMIAGTLLCAEGLWSFSGGMIAVPDEAAMALAMLLPQAPRGWRLDMLYGGTAPADIVQAIAEEEAELHELFESLEDVTPRPSRGRKPHKGKKAKPVAESKRQRQPVEPDGDQVELDAAANVIALALEAGGAEMTKYK